MTLRVSIAQTRGCVGEIDGNLKLADRLASEAAASHSDVLVLPEMFLTGYFLSREELKVRGVYVFVGMGGLRV